MLIPIIQHNDYVDVKDSVLAALYTTQRIATETDFINAEEFKALLNTILAGYVTAYSTFDTEKEQVIRSTYKLLQEQHEPVSSFLSGNLLTELSSRGLDICSIVDLNNFDTLTGYIYKEGNQNVSVELPFAALLLCVMLNESVIELILSIINPEEKGA